MASRDAPLVWRGAFLCALGESANVTWSAREAGVDKSTAYSARKADVAFALSWERALATGRAALAAGVLPKRGRPADGREISIRRSKSGKPCMMFAGEGRWSPKTEALFLGLLQTTANVKASARAIGFSANGVYAHKRKDPAFAQAWRTALAEGYDRVELGLIARASNAIEPFDWAGEAGIEADDLPEVSTTELLNILKLHRASVSGGREQRYGWRKALPDIEAVRAEVLRKIALLERARGDDGAEAQA